jgi:hypothetical protein
MFGMVYPVNVVIIVNEVVVKNIIAIITIALTRDLNILSDNARRWTCQDTTTTTAHKNTIGKTEALSSYYTIVRVNPRDSAPWHFGCSTTHGTSGSYLAILTVIANILCFRRGDGCIGD